MVFLCNIQYLARSNPDAGRAAAGAVRIGNAVGAAFTGRRVVLNFGRPSCVLPARAYVSAVRHFCLVRPRAPLQKPQIASCR